MTLMINTKLGISMEDVIIYRYNSLTHTHTTHTHDTHAHTHITRTHTRTHLYENNIRQRNSVNFA